MRLFQASLGLAVSASAAASPLVLFAGSGWAAIDRGMVCEALSRSAKIAPRGKVQATAGYAFTPDHRRWGEFHAQLSRVSRPGSSVILHIGDQVFLQGDAVGCGIACLVDIDLYRHRHAGKYAQRLLA